MGVSKGSVYTLLAGATAWGTPTNNTNDDPPLNFVGVVYSAPNVEKLWFADGVNFVYYDARTDSVERWSASAGELPTDSEGNAPRLICTWRGRTVVSGLLLDSQNWFMSAIGDPTNFDYAPTNPTVTQAIDGTTGPQGLVGDVITALIPYNDDILIFGCDSSIFLMAGDPMDGGRIDRVSDAIGMAWGLAWAKDPYGTVYFVSNKTGIYTLRPGELPQRISQQVEQLVSELNTGETTIRLAWDDKTQSMNFWFTVTELPSSTRHLVFERRTGSWFEVVYGNDDHNPIAVCTFDGNQPGDRVVLMGGWDGFVRCYDADAEDDDGTVIESSVLMGPINSKVLDEMMLAELQAVLDTESGSVSYSVLPGRTAQEALTATAVFQGTWSAGRNLVEPVRRAAHAFYVLVEATGRWSFEQLRALVGPRGMVRRRGR